MAQIILPHAHSIDVLFVCGEGTGDRTVNDNTSSMFVSKSMTVTTEITLAVHSQKQIQNLHTITK